MKRHAFTLIELMVLIASVMVLTCLFTAFFYPIGAAARGNARRSACQSNLKPIGMAFREYAQDYDTKFPMQNASGFAYGWADTLQPYLKSTQVLQCPSDKSDITSDPASAGYTDYWFNRRLAGVAEKQVKNASITILIGDGSSGLDVTDARYSKYRLPPRWIQDTNSPAYRHLGGANYAFADGHVKWCLPKHITNLPVARHQPTFAIR